jgi:hypothetical protein
MTPDGDEPIWRGMFYEGRAVQKPRHKYKMRTCEICGREYKAWPHSTKRGRVSYTGTCCYCGTYDGSRVPGRGHIELAWEVDVEQDDNTVADIY